MALDPDEALARVLAAVGTPTTTRLPPEDCLGLVLAEPALADGDLPPFDRAMMDGFAVRLVDAGRLVIPLAEIAAGDVVMHPAIVPGQAHPIMTGAPVPAGAEAVVAIEQTTREGDRIRLPERIRSGANIVVRGSECPAGRAWAEAGATVTPLTLAAALGVGCTTLAVHPRPRVGVITTGSELAADPSSPGQIRDSNGPMLIALLREAGIPAQRQSVDDAADTLLQRLQALADRDAVVLTGGVSAGTHDEVPGVLRRLGAEILFHHVAQKPGKPLLVARRDRQMIFALPGNPLAAHLCACRYVLPALRRLAGLPYRPGVGRGQSSAPLPANGDRIWYLPVRVAAGVVTPLLPVSSADLVQPHQANAYVRLEPSAPPTPSGSDIAFTRIGADCWGVDA